MASQTSSGIKGTPDNQALSEVHDSVVTFKEPTTTALKRNKPKILTEEKYIEEMARLIQRDFFPDLDKLRAQNEYLDAMGRKDYVKMAAIRAKYSGRRPTDRSGSLTPATFETPLTKSKSNTPRQETNTPADTPESTRSTQTTASVETATSNAEGGRRSIGERHSLDSFLQKYTSEDNDSFQQIIDRAHEKLRDKYNIFYRHEQQSAEQLACALNLPSIEKQFEITNEPRKIETWTYKNINSIMYTPEGVELTEQEQIEAVNRRQSIQHRATRLGVNPFNDIQRRQETQQIVNSQSMALNGKIGLDGNALSADGKNNNNNYNNVEGAFNLVATPSPRPGESFSPLMTWGEIEGTPFRLDGGDTPLHNTIGGPCFKITENSRRENIALALAERVGEKMRAQKQRAMDTARRNIAHNSTPFMRSNMERLASMSPAARRLASSKLGIRSPLLTTPSPQTTPRRSPSIPAVRAKTTNQAKSKSGGDVSTLTDNLLQIPTNKRKQAADFF